MNYDPLHPRYETSCLFKKTGSINFFVKHRLFENDPVSYLSHYGNLYSGFLTPNTFKKIFQEEKARYLSELTSVSKTNNTQLQPAAFKTMLCREALKSSWRWPALVNQHPSGRYNFSTGLGRLLATGFVHRDPWKHLKILLFTNKNIIPDDFLEDFVLIKTGQDLNVELNLSPESNSHPAVELEMAHSSEGPGGLAMAALTDGNTDFSFNSGDTYLDNFRKWYEIYNTKPTLYVYTDWPELIKDSAKFWDIQIAGPSKYKYNNFHLGHLEFSLREENSNPTHISNHVLYVTDQIFIDVSDLLAWVDLEHSAWIDQKLQFVLFRDNNPYSMMFCSKSYI